MGKYRISDGFGLHYTIHLHMIHFKYSSSTPYWDPTPGAHILISAFYGQSIKCRCRIKCVSSCYTQVILEPHGHPAECGHQRTDAGHMERSHVARNTGNPQKRDLHPARHTRVRGLLSLFYFFYYVSFLQTLSLQQVLPGNRDV